MGRVLRSPWMLWLSCYISFVLFLDSLSPSFLFCSLVVTLSSKWCPPPPLELFGCGVCVCLPLSEDELPLVENNSLKRPRRDRRTFHSIPQPGLYTQHASMLGLYTHKRTGKYEEAHYSHAQDHQGNAHQPFQESIHGTIISAHDNRPGILHTGTRDFFSFESL